MANPNAPRGLIPYAYQGGGPYNGAVSTYYVPVGNATALFIGDPVILITNSSDGNGVQSVGIATAGATNYILGSFQGISNNAGRATIPLLQSSPVYLPAGQAAYVYVADDPNLLYWAQEDSAGGAMVSGASGQNVNLVAGAGNTTSGYSGWMLQSSSLNVDATYQMRIMQMLQEADNAVGAYAKWMCRINLNAVNRQLGI
ncbi:MAG TPA: hypothetical protein VMV33_17175 [Rhodocyclaceae bacterium]|nr:hypothetical protein [Rhodocyclaceae bacterium]